MKLFEATPSKEQRETDIGAGGARPPPGLIGGACLRSASDVTRASMGRSQRRRCRKRRKTALEDATKEKAHVRDAMHRNPAAPSLGQNSTSPDGANGVRIAHNMQGAECGDFPPENDQDYLTPVKARA